MNDKKPLDYSRLNCVLDFLFDIPQDVPSDDELCKLANDLKLKIPYKIDVIYKNDSWNKEALDKYRVRLLKGLPYITEQEFNLILNIVLNLVVLEHLDMSDDYKNIDQMILNRITIASYLNDIYHYSISDIVYIQAEKLQSLLAYLNREALNHVSENIEILISKIQLSSNQADSVRYYSSQKKVKELFNTATTKQIKQLEEKIKQSFEEAINRKTKELEEKIEQLSKKAEPLYQLSFFGIFITIILSSIAAVNIPMLSLNIFNNAEALSSSILSSSIVFIIVAFICIYEILLFLKNLFLLSTKNENKIKLFFKQRIIYVILIVTAGIVFKILLSV